MNDKELLTVREAAELLSVAESTVYEWAGEQRIPVVRLGRRTLRFRRVDLLRWIDAQNTPAN